MVKWCASCVFCFVIITGGYGSVIDSLKSELSKRQTKDTNRVNVLNELGYQYWTFDPDLSKEYSQQALQLSEELNYKKGYAFANRSLGVASWTQGDYESGLSYLLTALIEYQSLSDTLNIANVMMNTALIYVEQDGYDEAFRYFTEALNTFKLLKKPKRYINTANHFGELLQKQQNYDQALAFFRNSLNISDSIKYNYGKATSYLNLGSLYKEIDRLDSAVYYSQQAIKIQSSSADLNGLATSYYTLGTIYMLRNEYAMAEDNLNMALNIAEQLKSKKLKRDIYFELSTTSKIKKDYRSTADYLEKYALLNDSLLSAELIKNIARFESQIELDKKEAELEKQEYQLEILEKEARIDDLLKLALVLGIIATLILMYLVWSRQQIKIKKNKELLKTSEELNESQKKLSSVAIENAKLKERELLQELEFKNKELTSYTLNFIRKNELLTEIKEGLTDLKKTKEPNKNKRLSSLQKLVDSRVNIDRDWDDFKRHFEEVHTHFFSALSEKFPEVTSNDLKLCALLKLNMNLKEAANVMGISPESVKTARYRLRKKLGLSTEDNLVEFIINFSAEHNGNS